MKAATEPEQEKLFSPTGSELAVRSVVVGVPAAGHEGQTALSPPEIQNRTRSEPDQNQIRTAFICRLDKEGRTQGKKIGHTEGRRKRKQDKRKEWKKKETRV